LRYSWLSRFRSLFNLILLGAFLAFSSLGAGSGKRTRKPLGAHQERILIAIKEKMALIGTDLRFLYCTENSHVLNSSKDLSNHHFIFITPIRMLLITNRKRRSFTPYSKLRRAYTVKIASRADSGQWLVHERQILLSTERA
jgi:hypothetical protein